MWCLLSAAFPASHAGSGHGEKHAGDFVLGSLVGITTGDSDCWDISWYTRATVEGSSQLLLYTTQGWAKLLWLCLLQVTAASFIFCFTLLVACSPAELIFVSVQDPALLAIRAIQILDFGLDLHHYQFCPGFINA